jgi:hypothetical protein
LGNRSPTTQPQEYLEVQRVASSEAGVDDDLYDGDPRDDDLYCEDPRVVETHSRIGDLTDYLWSIPGFEDYCTALGDAARENKDSNELEGDDDTVVDFDSVEGDDDTEVDVDSVETGSIYTRGFRMRAFSGCTG